METPMKVNGKMIWLMGKEFLLQLTEARDMKESGATTSTMASAKKAGLMALGMKASSPRAKRTDEVLTSGQMEHLTQETGWGIK